MLSCEHLSVYLNVSPSLSVMRAVVVVSGDRNARVRQVDKADMERKTQARLTVSTSLPFEVRGRDLVEIGGDRLAGARSRAISPERGRRRRRKIDLN